MLNNIRVVLVRTYHPGNIGSVARAMKTMGLTDLRLVSPIDFPSDVAFKMAMSAKDVLQTASQTATLFDAVKNCRIVIASTARARGYDLPYLNPEESAQKLLQFSQKEKVALVFGPERMGLSNEDLQYCNYRVTIPTHPDYSSLNLAAAVQTLSYEIYKIYSINNSENEDNNFFEKEPRSRPDVESLEQLYEHLENTLGDTGFIIKNHPGDIMKKLRQIFTRAELDESELSILRGILASVDRRSVKK